MTKCVHNYKKTEVIMEVGSILPTAIFHCTKCLDEKKVLLKGQVIKRGKDFEIDGSLFGFSGRTY